MEVLKNLSVNLAVSALLILGFSSCQTRLSDTDLQTKVETALINYPNIQIAVNDGQVTLSGTATSDDERRQIQSAAKASDSKAIKSVVNNIAVTATPVEINTDDADLQAQANDFVNDFPNVEVIVAEGVIMVTGEIKQSQVQKLQTGLDALNPIRLDLSGLTIK